MYLEVLPVTDGYADNVTAKTYYTKKTKNID